jgi:hypothetical protein
MDLIEEIKKAPDSFIIFVEHEEYKQKYYMCVVSQERYKLEENYKITLKSLREDIPYIRHLYITDFLGLVKDSIIRVYKEF